MPLIIYAGGASGLWVAVAGDIIVGVKPYIATTPLIP